MTGKAFWFGVRKGLGRLCGAVVEAFGLGVRKGLGRLGWVDVIVGCCGGVDSVEGLLFGAGVGPVLGDGEDGGGVAGLVLGGSADGSGVFSGLG